jgi:hypothetical protein
MVDKSELERRTADAGRVYTNFDDVYLPSVSTVLDEIPEPDGLQYWREKYDGEDGRKDWRDILTYKSNRGTLIHYHLLNQFYDGDMWGIEEQNSKESLQSNSNWERFEEDLTFAEEFFEEVSETYCITEQNVLEVECFVTNTDIGYAGQFDMLHIDCDGNICLSDIKTSKRVYKKHKLQLTAYAEALNFDVDRLEVIRIHPDSDSGEVSPKREDVSYEWLENRDELLDEFIELRNGMDSVESDFKDIVDDGRKG